MTRRPRPDLCVSAVPASYRPGYPRRLSPEEFRALVERPAASRIRRILLAGGLAFGVPRAAAQEVPAGDAAAREARILEMLRRVDGGPGAHWFWMTSFRKERAEDGFAEPVPVPHIPIMFGNSNNGVFDADEARARAIELFRVYGLEPEAGVKVEAGGGTAVLDGADRARKVAFELRGAPGTGAWGPEAKEEPVATGLEAAEYRGLQAEGWRVHVADVNLFGVADGDRFEASLAWIAGVVDFLNGVTDGPDVDLTALLFGWKQRFALPTREALGLPASARFVGREDDEVLVIEETATILLRFARPDGSPSALGARGHVGTVWEVLERPLPTAGRPSLVEVPIGRAPDGWREPANVSRAPLLRLRQERGEGRPPIVLESRSPMILTPSAFDAARPFDVEIVLEPGRYSMGDAILVATMPR